MHDERTFRGLWWLPHDESNRLAGTLTFADGAGTLETIGDFGHKLLAETAHEKQYSLELARQPRILGASTDGKQITLEATLPLSHVESFPGMSTATYRGDAALVGKHFIAEENIGFDEISIRASDLNEWTQLSGLTGSLKLPIGSGVEMRYEPPDDVIIELARGELAQIRFGASSRGFGPGSTSFELRQEATFHLRFARRVTLADAQARVIQVRNFLSLAVARPVAILSVAGYQLDSGTGDRRLAAEIFWEIPNNPKPPSSLNDPRSMLFTLPEATPSISKVMRNWFAKQQRLTPVFDLFFGVRHHPTLPLEVRFLTYAQAVETYDFRRRRRPGNYSLAERMGDVLGQCRTTAKRIVGADTEDEATFIQRFKNTRNYYTHYNPRLESTAARGAELYLLFVQVQAILEMSLLRELGFGCRAIDLLLDRTSRYREIQHFKALVAEER
jgi:hypothetical protein